ncbi:MAG: hypothetical protein A2901_01660 [Elusimicrobia bacterium RIFCSPLOWO2_01_FULL_54_10]|nr:MAG: hypothetical protein A2901_01660 [Elusimicrobia bacterium RIFCSPLOWO2_01_FULL_54_10]
MAKQQGLSVSLWEIVESQVQFMREKRSLPFLKELKIPSSMVITSNMAEALKDAEVVFSIVPSQFVRETWKKAKAHVGKLELVASLSKGIEAETLKSMTQVIADEVPQAKDKIAVVSGPSHAEEVARDVPTAVIAASEHKAVAELAQKLLNTRTFRVYTSPDVIGAEICGALKNIFAIACGACDGLGLGDNTKAALMTRGLHEMAKLGTHLGANQITFFGLAGMGDLIVTCMSQHSRNRLLGEKIGKGKSALEALKEMTMVAEGYPNSRSAFQLIQKTGCECPLITEIYHVLYDGKNIQECLNDLLSRPLPAYGESRDIPWRNN